MKISNTKNLAVDSLKFVIYGESGNGKTTLAGTLKEPTLIISAESGLLSLNGKDIDVINLAQDDQGNVVPEHLRIDRLREAFLYVQKPEVMAKYKWLFIDSLSEISANLLVKLNKDFPERKDALVMYGENAKRLKAIIKEFRDLPHYNVVMTALCGSDKDEEYHIYKTVDVVGGLAKKIPAMFDEVFYIGKKESEDGSFTRYIQTASGSDKLIVKDRSGKLNSYEKPDLQAIADKIRSELKPSEEIELLKSNIKKGIEKLGDEATQKAIEKALKNAGNSQEELTRIETKLAKLVA